MLTKEQIESIELFFEGCELKLLSYSDAHKLLNDSLPALTQHAKDAAQRIEELEKQVAELEFQVKVSPVRAVIEMYDNEDFGAEEIYSFVQDFLRLQGEEFNEQWQLALDVIWGNWDENYYSETLDPDECINRIREVIGMAIPT